MTPFEAGVAHFNAGAFWEAHEAWESIWLESEGDTRKYLQGLIQLAAAYYHVRRGNFRGATRLFDAAMAKLAPFPMLHRGLDRSDAIAAATLHREQTAAHEIVPPDRFPTLRLMFPDW